MSNNTQVNLPQTSGDVIATTDIAGVKHQQVIAEFDDGAGGATKVSAANPLPVAATISTVGLATSANQVTELSTLDAILAKITASAATAARQDTGNTSLASIDTKLSSQATAARQDTGNTSLSSIDTKLTSQATAAKQDTQTALLTTIDGDTSNLDTPLSTRLKAADTLAAVALISDIRQATASNLNMTEASAAAIKTAVETIDNFISGSRGLVTEDNSAAIKTAVEVIDNFISGSRGLVTEDNSEAIKASLDIIDDWDESDRGKVNAIVGQAGLAGGTGVDAANALRVSLATNVALPAGTNLIGKTGIDQTTPGTTNKVSIGTDGTVAVTGVSADGTQTGSITAADIATTTTSGANNQSIMTGSPTANSAASFVIAGMAGMRVQVTGTWAGTLQIEQSFDGGTTWYMTGVHQTGTAYTTSPFTLNFGGGLNVSGATNFRVRATSFSSGTASVTIVATQNTNSIYVANALRMQDATTQTIQASIKAGNTAPLGTDTGLVVSLSPNSANMLGMYRQNEELLLRAYLQNIIGMEDTEKASAGAYGFELR